MTKPTTHTLPADAFRADRGKTDADGSMYVDPPEQFSRRDPGSDHRDTIELRLSRLEAWTRSEIFARTAMDDPDPERQPVPVSDDELARVFFDAYFPNLGQHATRRASPAQAIMAGIRAVRAALDAAKETDHER